jgi:hypothetical protein
MCKLADDGNNTTPSSSPPIASLPIPYSLKPRKRLPFPSGKPTLTRSPTEAKVAADDHNYAIQATIGMKKGAA